MRTTIQRDVFSSLLLLCALGAEGQGTFQNLGFENTTLTVFVRNPFIPSYATNATIPGWGWSPHETFGFGDPNTTVALDGFALDAPAVTLQANSSRAIQGYTVFLQGGTMGGGLVTGNTNGAFIYQTGQIPTTSQSLTYLGSGAVRVAFNGQLLPSIVISNAATHTVWGVDISAYAGQSGELRFTSPWLASGLLDDIRFSPAAIPEPSALALYSLGLGVLILFGAMKRPLGRRKLHPDRSANYRAR